MVFARLVEHWRAMTPAARLQLSEQLCLDVERLALAGIRAAHPEYGPLETARELTRRRYGPSLARDAYAGLSRHG